MVYALLEYIADRIKKDFLFLVRNFTDTERVLMLTLFSLGMFFANYTYAYAQTTIFLARIEPGKACADGTVKVRVCPTDSTNKRDCYWSCIVPSPTPTPLPSPSPLPSTTPIPSVTPTPTPVVTVEPTPNSAQPGIIISQSEILALPRDNRYTAVKNIAYGLWGTPTLANQDDKTGLQVLAGALISVRDNDVNLRNKTKNAIMSIIGTESDTGARVLSVGRNLGPFIFAADIIDLKNNYPSDDQTFRSWLNTMRTKNIGGHSRWVTLTQTHENGANNWGTFAGASRIAASIYLNDTRDVERAANVFRAWLGERSYYPPDAPGFDEDGDGDNDYFQHQASTSTMSFDLNWECPGKWTAVNPNCDKFVPNIGATKNLNGVIVEDMVRGGTLQWPPIYTGYPWEALQGVFVQAELLYRRGYDSYSWGNQALKRAMNFHMNLGWTQSTVFHYVPWMANYRYNTNYSTLPSTSGRVFSYGDWLFGSRQ
jgi:hypothetical protein